MDLAFFRGFFASGQPQFIKQIDKRDDENGIDKKGENNKPNVRGKRFGVPIFESISDSPCHFSYILNSKIN